MIGFAAGVERPIESGWSSLLDGNANTGWGGFIGVKGKYK